MYVKNNTNDQLINYIERYNILSNYPNIQNQSVKEKVNFINCFREEYKLKNLFFVLKINKKTYYKHRYSLDKDYFDYLLIKNVFIESKCTYGYRRIDFVLRNKYGVIMNHKKILRIMNKYGLKPRYIKAQKEYKHIEENVRPYLLNRNFKADYRNQKWCTDITNIKFQNHTLYLSSIIDLYDSRIVAYNISNKNNIKLVIDTINKAILTNPNVNGLIINSDQGWQYTSNEYKEVLTSHGITISMSNKGLPLDNSPIECWHSLLKKETLYNSRVSSINELQKLIEDWIEFYNTERISIKKG